MEERMRRRAAKNWSPSGWQPLVIGALLLCVALGLTACGGSSSGSSEVSTQESTESSTAGSKPTESEPAEGEQHPVEAEGLYSDSGKTSGGDREKSLYLIRCFDANPWCAAYHKAFEPIIEEAGIELTTLTQDFDPNQESEDFDQAIAAKPGAIATFPASDPAAVPALMRAKATGIPTILLETEPEPQDAEAVDLSLPVDAPKEARLVTEALVKAMEAEGLKGGNVMMLTGVASERSVHLQVETAKEVLAEHPGFKVVVEEDTQWDQTKSQEIASQAFAQWKTKGGIQGVWADSDAILAGAIQAAQSLHIPFGEGKGTVGVSDACFPIGIENMEAGLQAASIAQSPTEMGRWNAETIVEWFGGKEMDAVQPMPTKLITPANLKQTRKACEF
jgi:ribose transport system substrate-binding protein